MSARAIRKVVNLLTIFVFIQTVGPAAFGTLIPF